MRITTKIIANMCLFMLTAMFKVVNAYADYQVDVRVVNSYFTQVSQCNTACPSTHRSYTALVDTGSQNASCYCYASNCVCSAGYTGSAEWGNYGGNNTYRICLQSGCCTDCTTTGWSTCATGYESAVTSTTCTNTVCTKTTSYRCSTNYYGNPTTCGAGCTVCPPLGTASGFTTGAGSTTAVGRCWISDGIAITDTTGTFDFSSKCIYN